MKSFYVLLPPAPKDLARETLFVRDGFSWFGFLLPLPWLLVRRMWIVALLAIIFYAVTVYLAEAYRLDALPVAFSVVLSLWVGLEGGFARVWTLERRGWRVDRVLVAETVGDAEAIYFAGKSENVKPANEMPASFAIVPGQPRTNVAALGLLDPNGGR